MAEVMVLPYQLVDLYRKPGLMTDAGIVPMDQYLSKNKSCGGNDNLNSLMEKIRFMKDQGTGPTLNTILGGSRCDVLLKGQGRPEDFVTTWNFLIRNRDRMKKVDIQVAKRRPKNDPDKVVVEKSGTVYDLYFKGNSDAQAIKNMVRDRFFGIDCIGLVANYMIYCGAWTKYHGYKISQWASLLFKKNVKKAADVQPLNILVWDGHIAVVDWVWGTTSDKSVEVDICQSSSSDECQGPQCNESVILTETAATKDGRKLFKIETVGSPRMPVTGHAVIMRREDFYW